MNAEVICSNPASSQFCFASSTARPIFLMVFNFVSSNTVLFIFITSKGSSNIYNIFVWLSLFMGNGVLMCLYSQEWYARQNCQTTPEIVTYWVSQGILFIFVCYENNDWLLRKALASSQPGPYVTQVVRWFSAVPQGFSRLSGFPPSGKIQHFRSLAVLRGHNG